MFRGVITLACLAVLVPAALGQDADAKIKALEERVRQLEKSLEKMTKRLEEAEKKLAAGAAQPIDLEKIRLTVNEKLKQAFPEDSVVIPPKGIDEKTVAVHVRTRSIVNAAQIEKGAPAIISPYLPKRTIILTTPK